MKHLNLSVWFCLWCFMTGVLLLRPIGDEDVFTQIKLGQLMIERGELIHSEAFSYLNLGKEIRNPGWLAQGLLAIGYEAGGFMLLKFINAALFALAVLLPLAAPGAAALMPRVFASLLAFVVLIPHCALRPQTISLLGFALLLRFLLRSAGCLKQLLWWCFTFIIWQNSHPSLVMAVILAGVFLLADFKQIRVFLPMILLAFVCQLLTPDGLAVFEVGSRNLEISRNLLGISEWVPPWSAMVRDAVQPFWLSLAITALLVCRYWKLLQLREWLLFSVFCGLSLYAARFTAYFALAMVPVWGSLFNPICGRLLIPIPRLRRVLCALGVLMLPFGYLSGPVIQNEGLPLAAIQKLQALKIKGHIYNYREWGGPLTFYGYPDWQVALDGRLYLYPPPLWDEYSQAALGHGQLEDLIGRHRPAAFFLNRQFQSGLIEQIAKGVEWCSLFQDEQAELFVECTRVP